MSIEPAILPGQILLGKYRVERLIGRGGMGMVFAARHLQLDEEVAIKILLRELAEHPEAFARLRREARILAKVRNEHVVQVFDLGQLEDGAPYMVMEHLVGRDLGSLLQDEQRFGVERAVEFVLQALVALAVAHASGIVHRDLKPENLFCTQRPDGSPLIKVLDFGISRLDRLAEGGAATPMTHSGAMIGTPVYMSPEQLRSPHDVDARSDIWSVGVVLYELLTGVLPFSGVAIGDVALKIALDPPQALNEVGAQLPDGLEAVLLRCLQKEREKRFANVADLARALAPFAPQGAAGLVERTIGITAGRGPVAREAELLGSGEAPPSGHRLETPRAAAGSRRRQLLRLAAVGAFAAGIGALSLLLAPRAPGRRSELSPARATAWSGSEQASAATPADVASVAPSPSANVGSGEAWGERPREAGAAASSRKESVAGTKQRAVLPSGGTLPSNGFCNPPYTVDLQGRKKFKHECFTSPR